MSAACSVHLAHQPPEGGDVEAFYNEVTVEKTAECTFFMTSGWVRGYSGIQELNNGQTCAIFSVWDEGSEMYAGTDDHTQTKLEDRVQVIYGAPDCSVSRFGGEGTGAKCMFKPPIGDRCWVPGKTYGLLVTSAPYTNDKGMPRHLYSGHFWDPEKGWKHLATFEVGGRGPPLKNFYSFVEDFKRTGAGENRTA
eukprot:Cvel_22218.t1-p1 / transcript=Cvel_22218.t1 / gene=Cvel_22218 / organism=Chromera_velia_CCMP2878 / gene_product=hypothetical protein / transcript_product=hypothetical protein / location=Cvel_scaffold2160:29640-32163(+) / protein_length=193 / sequence_SO=supercontig / SO=protein_coding / is_pseudo=false